MLKTLLRPILILWEKFFSWKEKIYIVENSPYGLVRMAVHPYTGKPVNLKDGTQVNPGDYIIELHISNLTLAQGKVANVEVASDLQLLPLFREEFYNLGRLAAEGKLDPKAKAIWGITMMGPGVRRLGFTLQPMEDGWHKTSMKIWMSFLKWIFSPSTTKHSQKARKATREPQEYWMSMKQLVAKYGK